MSDDSDRTASLMSPAKLAQLRAQPAAATPAAWLNQMAADAGSLHVRRMLELGQQLEAHIRDSNFSALCSALQSLDGGSARLDFTLLQPRGWLARATGKSKGAVAEFLTQHEQVSHAVDEVARQAQLLLKKRSAQAGTSDRSLTEFELELRAIEKVMDQGTRWLQDMRNQLKARDADASDAAAQQKRAHDAARCDLLVDRLKKLRVAATAASQVQQQLRALTSERANAMQSLRQALDGEVKAWRRSLDSLASQADGVDTAIVAEAMQSHDQLRSRVKQLQRELVQLQSGEGVLVEELALLAEPLQAAS